MMNFLKQNGLKWDNRYRRIGKKEKMDLCADLWFLCRFMTVSLLQAPSCSSNLSLAAWTQHLQNPHQKKNPGEKIILSVPGERWLCGCSPFYVSCLLSSTANWQGLLPERDQLLPGLWDSSRTAVGRTGLTGTLPSSPTPLRLYWRNFSCCWSTLCNNSN